MAFGKKKQSPVLRQLIEENKVRRLIYDTEKALMGPEYCMDCGEEKTLRGGRCFGCRWKAER